MEVFFFLKLIQECNELSNQIMPNVDMKVARKSCCHLKTFSSLIVYRKLCSKIQGYFFPTIIIANLHHVKKKKKSFKTSLCLIIQSPKEGNTVFKVITQKLLHH